MVANSSALVLVLVGNNLYYDWNQDITPPNQCLSDESTAIGVAARDYTPYYYLLMTLSTFMSFVFILLMNPSMRRSKADENKATIP